MPVTVSTAKQKGPYTFTELIAQKTISFGEPALVLRSHADSVYLIFLHFDD